ncbi:MAG: hypothetical protein PHV34_14415 [Verrucomicrobiae bacterium]|nr:hypothetical protein [Verrucomicrobiae bacterium]
MIGKTLCLVIAMECGFHLSSSAQVSFKDSGVNETKVDFHGNCLTHYERSVGFCNQGPVSYVFQYDYFDPSVKGETLERPLPAHVKFPVIGDSGNGTMGLGVKGGAWYAGGFFGVRVKEWLNKTLMQKMTIVEQGRRGLLECLWTGKFGGVKARFMMLPEDDKLFMELDVDASVDEGGVSVLFFCIPGHNGWSYDGYNREQDKWICTPARNIQHHDGEDSIDPQKGPWILYFDSKNNQPFGSCALMWLPGQVESILVGQKSNRYVTTHIRSKPLVKNIRFILWNFPDGCKKPVGAYEYLKNHGEEWMEQLKAAKFGPEDESKEERQK